MTFDDVTMSRDHVGHASVGWAVSNFVEIRDIPSSRVLGVLGGRLRDRGRLGLTNIPLQQDSSYTQWTCWSQDGAEGCRKMFSMQHPSNGVYFFIAARRNRISLQRWDEPSLESVDCDDPRVFIFTRNPQTNTQVLKTACSNRYLNNMGQQIVIEDIPSGDNNWSLEQLE